MKTVYLLRHAKAEDGLRKKDFDRELTDTGISEAKKIAERLLSLNEKPQLIISSPARRAIDTARITAKVLKYPISELIIEPKIYNSENYFELFDVIKNTDDDYDSLMLVGHNPTLKQLSDKLFEKNVEWFPKNGVIGLEFDVNNWKNISFNSGILLFFTHPKEFIYYDLTQLKNLSYEND